jgi:hypothetical protein
MPSFRYSTTALTFGVCGLLVTLGIVVFVRNAVGRGDPDYEARFPWLIRLSLYLFVSVIPQAGMFRPTSLNDSAWTTVLLETETVAFAIPLVGLLGSLGLVALKRTREHIKLAKGLLFVSLLPIIFWIGIAVGPARSGIH